MFGSSINSKGSSVFGGGFSSAPKNDTNNTPSQQTAPVFGAGAFAIAASESIDGDQMGSGEDISPSKNLPETAFARGIRLQRADESQQLLKRRTSSSTSTGNAAKSLLNKAIAMKSGAAGRGKSPHAAQSASAAGRMRQAPSAIGRGTVRMATGTLRNPFFDRGQEVVIGTCLDMCPEKERYLRAVGKQLRAFELGLDGAVDHAKCVKEYTRSSADQDEPLAHELRPLGVLQRTMTHLMISVGDKRPNPTDHNAMVSWYEFLWDRTRAIRKELTQQILVSPGAIEIVEQCVAFHLYTGYFLCECKIDQKLNNENRGKSMQTLRHMYEDLARNGHFCANEARFHSLDALANIDDANTLPTLLRHGPRVTESAECRLAVNLIRTYHTNNYVRFFRLLRGASDFLIACALHRHIDNFRTTALGIMVATAGTGHSCDLQTIYRTLAFDTLQEAAEFCDKHGLVLIEEPDSQEPLVRLDRRTFHKPTVEDFPPRRCNLVDEESPGDGSLAVIVGCSDGSLLQGFQKPADSFDVHGRYANDPVIAEYFSAAAPSEIAEIEQEPELKFEPETAENTRERMRASQIGQIIDQLTPYFCEDILFEASRATVLFECNQALKYRMRDRLLEAACNDLIRALVNKEYSDAVKAKREAERQATMKRLVNLTTEKCANLVLDKAVTFLADVTLKAELKKQVLTSRKQELSNRATKMYEEFYDCFMEWFIRKTCEETFADRVTRPLERVEISARRARLREAARCFFAWRKIVHNRRRTLRYLDTFPTGCLAVADGQKLRVSDRVKIDPKYGHDSFDSLKSQLDEDWYTVAVREFGKIATDQTLAMRQRCQRTLLQRHFDAWTYTSRLHAARKRTLADFGTSFGSAVDSELTDTDLSQLSRRRRLGDSGNVDRGLELFHKRRRVSVADLQRCAAASRLSNGGNSGVTPSNGGTPESQTPPPLNSSSLANNHSNDSALILSEGVAEHRSWGMVRMLQHSVSNKLAAFKARIASDQAFWQDIMR